MVRKFLVCLALAACAQQPPKPTVAEPQPPVARKEPKDVSVHGDKRIDDYFWLRQKGTPEVEKYLNDESAYADALMQPTSALQQRLYAELLSRVQETDVQVPFPRDGVY